MTIIKCCFQQTKDVKSHMVINLGYMVGVLTLSIETLPVCKSVRAAVCGRTLSCSKNTPGQQDTLFVCFYCFMQTAQGIAVVQSIDHLTMVQKLKKKQFFLLEKPCQHDFATTLHYLGCLWQ